MFKWFVISVLFVFFPGSYLSGQNYFISNPYHNYLYQNPSFPLFNEYSLALLNYRNQWPASNLYSTYGIAYYHYAEKLSSNIGTRLYYDNQYNGTFNKVAAGLNYAYKITVGRTNNLLFGLEGIYNFRKSNYNNLQFENNSIATPEGYSKSFININAGMGLILNKEHFVGLSITNIFSGDTDDSFTVNGSYIGNIQLQNYYSGLYIQPLVALSGNRSYFKSYWGSNIQYNEFKAGLLFNTYDLNFSALTILLGISFENNEFVYTYDLNLSANVSLNPKMAAHEVTFLRKFQYKEKRKKRYKAIKCPDI